MQHVILRFLRQIFRNDGGVPFRPRVERRVVKRRRAALRRATELPRPIECNQPNKPRHVYSVIR